LARTSHIYLTHSDKGAEVIRWGDRHQPIDIGSKDRAHLAVLVKYVNNQALRSGIEQIFCVWERDHVLPSSMKGFIHVDTAIHLYIKSLQKFDLVRWLVFSLVR
jgi:hypothetical protein